MGQYITDGVGYGFALDRVAANEVLLCNKSQKASWHPNHFLERRLQPEYAELYCYGSHDAIQKHAWHFC